MVSGAAGGSSALPAYKVTGMQVIIVSIINIIIVIALLCFNKFALKDYIFTTSNISPSCPLMKTKGAQLLKVPNNVL